MVARIERDTDNVVLARHLWDEIVEGVAEWLRTYWPDGSADTDDMAERWREEMS
jgi:hypothetical protein